MTYPRGIAYHEAGHAVVGWALGLRVGISRLFYDDVKGCREGRHTPSKTLEQSPACC
jgi:hypothetical protein